ncbi:MAG: class I mannose-6-phosphate isomerase [Cytophagaceae bacterium]|nr:class I mannose-6-phosphate isomerase [Cytophagaceae bacterium]MDW8456563.1 mannose-6-phosphate isomerase [Cytophagaceae bacterium]
MQLYPLAFKTIFKDKIWGGQKIKTILNKDFSPLPNCGETWEISGVEGNVSEVADGNLTGAKLTELIEKYKGKLVGEKVFEKYGNQFPLLIKFIDANDDLSIQVHPNDELAKKRHNSFGKTEMWYILQADPGAQLNSGFNQPMTKEKYLHHLHSNTLHEILNMEPVQAGDVFFLPAGRIHYIGKGICLAEIQQTSDITYRIYDFDRTDDKGNKRELHTDLALDAIDYSFYENYKTSYTLLPNNTSPLVACPYFTTNLISSQIPIEKNYSEVDSFVIYICIEGNALIETTHGNVQLSIGRCLLLPAEIKTVKIQPQPHVRLLETYLP